MQLLWVLGYEQLYGLARLGAKNQYQEPEQEKGTSKSHVKVLFSEWAQVTLRSYGEECNGYTDAKETIAGPDQSRTRLLFGKFKLQHWLSVGILAAHYRFSGYLPLFGAVENPNCK